MVAAATKGAFFMDLPVKILQSSSLFRDMSEAEVRQLVSCLGSPVRRYGKGSFLWQQGDPVEQAGIVLSGTVDAVQYREDGTAQLVARQTAGGVFGDLLMAAGQPSPVTLQAAEESEVLYLPLEKILGGCERCCPCHTRLRRNLLAEASEKFWALRQRLEYLSEPSLRRRILLYLRDEGRRAGTATFTIPYNREKLAEFLAVNRSALSRELSRLADEGVIEYYRSSFRILK